MSTVVQTLRHFNRVSTPRIGVLSDSYLGTGRPLGPSRLLFELGDGPRRVVDLRLDLGLDSGYLSRVLRLLETQGLVVVERDAADGRQRVVRLTGRGRREWARLDARSARVAADLVDPLSPSQRDRLEGALATAGRLLRLATVRIDAADVRTPAARRAVGEYFAELDRRFAGGFQPEAGGAEKDAELLAPPSGAFLLVRSDREVLGCGGVQRVDRTTAEIKRMWIDEAWRGEGLGPRLLAALEATARSLGYRRLVLDTNGSLTEAIAMYERNGYRRIERYNDNPYAQHWFAKRLPAGRAAGVAAPATHARLRPGPGAPRSNPTGGLARP